MQLIAVNYKLLLKQAAMRVHILVCHHLDKSRDSYMSPNRLTCHKTYYSRPTFKLKYHVL